MRLKNKKGGMPLNQQMGIRGGFDEETSFCLDPDYEFDAAQFFDLTRMETLSEEKESELWFDRALAYPPSPFSAKSQWGVPVSLNNFKKAKDFCRTNPYNDDKDPPPRVGPKSKAQVPALSIISGYMKPTASYLAKQQKQNHSEDSHFHRILRSPTVVRDQKTSSHYSSSNEMQATKRQKLDTGYLQKINHVKPRSPLQHKVAQTERKIDDWTLGKPKITVPREFSLETARRAIRHRSNNESNSIGQTTSNLRTSKSCASSHKVHSVPCMKKTALKSVEPLHQVLNIPAAKHPPPVDLFENLSIDSETRPNLRYQLASSMSSEMPEVESKEPSRTYVKQFQCGRDAIISDYQSLASLNRSLDIR